MASNNRAKTTRIVCISDTHSLYNFSLPPGDILVHAGDFTRTGTLNEIQAFLTYLASLTQYRLKIIIAGNHDLTLEPDFYEKSWERLRGRWRHKYKENCQQIKLLMLNPELRYNNGIIYLEEEEFTDPVTGLKFYGSPYQPGRQNWAFQKPPNSPEIQQIWSRIPNDIDVLITHSPPAYILDRTAGGSNVGCSYLLRRVKEIKPRLHVFGHIHESYGRLELNSTLFVNASICDLEYRPIQPAIIVDLEIKGTK